MKVLLATDGSSYADEAARLLSRLPHEKSLELTVLSVIHVPYVPSVRATKDWMAECVESEKSFAAQTFENVSEMFAGADATLQHIVREGNLGQTILDVAEEVAAELIVVGAKGHSAVDRILLGSTSDYVATHASCSVLVVRPTGLRNDPDRSLHVTLAYDDSASSQAAIEEIAEFRWGAQTKFEVVTVVSFISAFMSEIVIEPNEIKDAASQSVAEASERLANVAPQVRSRLIESDHIGEGIVKHIEAQSGDLIVVGDTGQGALSKALLGSISRYVLRHAPCSVWISRRKSR